MGITHFYNLIMNKIVSIFYRESNLHNSLILLNFMLITVFISTIKQFINHFTIFNFTFSAILPSAIISLLIDFFLTKKCRLFSYIILFFFIFISAISSSLLNNYNSWDSASYHLPAMYCQYLTNNLIFSGVEEASFWGAFYPKFTWIFSAELAMMIGKFTSLTTYHFIFALSLFLFSLHFFDKMNYNKSNGIIFSIFITLNPVFLAQIFSAYIDDVLGICTIYLILLSLLYIHKDNILYLILMTIISIIMINLKFSGCLFCFIPFMYIFFRSMFNYSRIKQIFFAGCIVLLAGVCVIGYNPYMNNLSHGRHLFYPLFGDNSKDIMTLNTPKDLRGEDRFTKFFKSTFSKPTNNRSKPLTLNIPFNKLYENKNIVKSTDCRICGFGTYFPLICILSFLTLIMSRQYKNNTVRDLLLMIFILFLANPESWWARYSVYLYLIPFIFLFTSKKSLTKWSKPIFLLILVPNIVILTVTSFVNIQRITSKVHRQIDATGNNIIVSESHKNSVQVKSALEHLGIVYNFGELTCKKTSTIHYSFVKIKYCKNMSIDE